jgi:hypothetical protein
VDLLPRLRIFDRVRHEIVEHGRGHDPIGPHRRKACGGFDDDADRLPVRYPLDLDAFDRDRQLSGVPQLFTVDLVTRYIAWKLGGYVSTGPINPNLESPI